LPHATFSYGILIYLEGLLMKFAIPVVRLIEERLILLFNVPHLVSVVRFECLVKLSIPPEERPSLQIVLHVASTIIIFITCS
jgi:hypothetical protein